MKLINKFKQQVELSEQENVSVDIYAFVDKTLSGITLPGTKKQMLELIPLLVSYAIKTNYSWLQISRLLRIQGFTNKLKETLMFYNPYEHGLNYSDIFYRLDKELLFTKDFIDFLLTQELKEIDIKFIVRNLCEHNNEYITYFLKHIKSDSRKLWDSLMLIVDLAENKNYINQNLELFLHNISDFNYILSSTNLTPINKEKVLTYIDHYVEEYNNYLATHFREIVEINTIYDKTKEISQSTKEQAIKDNSYIVDMIMIMIDELCRNEGVTYKDIKYAGGGFYSNAYQIGDKIIKIGHVRERFKFPNNPYIIAPLLRKRIELTNSNVDELYIEIQERVELLKPGNYTDDEIYELYKKVRNLGLIWFDVEPRNIGRLLKDNVIHWNSEIMQIDEVLGFEPKRGNTILKAGELVILDADFIFDYMNTPERYLEYDWDHTRNQRRYEARYQKELASEIENNKGKNLTL